ncbi:hypothetical protein [Streptomyces sp. MST-110588]|uniref:hypothetical protein n=1 Tax=Streptomyces sp. MST-110588 TaxID=2833628 RepID=UPI0032426169
MRPAYDATGPTPAHAAPRASATPIYDALYAEYRRSFRALPGDRTGEEEFSAEAMRRIWGRTTTSTGNWEVVARQPYQTYQPQHARTYVPAALPPAPHGLRPHGR